MKKNCLFIWSICWVFPAIGHDLTAIKQAYNKGNDLYQKARYEEAYKVYESITEKGYESPDLYYNMGNAAYKSNRIPLAIINYERAKQLNPNDKDIYFNLEMANLKIKDKIEHLPELFYKRWWKILCQTRTVDQWAIIGCLFIALGFLGLLLYVISMSIFAQKLSFWSGMIIMLLGAMSILCAFSNYKSQTDHKSAIVFTPGVSVQSSPTAQSTKLFIIHEGLKVTILEDIKGWYKIMLADGHIGWIKKSEVEII